MAAFEENIAFARPAASHEQVMEACRIARVDEFAENFEKKYDTIVGERGVKLSGGQRQRVSIARAILADPRILILDEATSSLDSESEALIQEGLKYLMKGRTTFVIAHRLSTIRRADQILVVEHGRIVERGTHAVALRAGRPVLGSLYAPARAGSESVPGAGRRRQSRRRHRVRLIQSPADGYGDAEHQQNARHGGGFFAAQMKADGQDHHHGQRSRGYGSQNGRDAAGHRQDQTHASGQFADANKFDQSIGNPGFRKSRFCLPWRSFSCTCRRRRLSVPRA